MRSFNFPSRLTVGLSVLLISGAVSASVEQLEADLRERLAGEGNRLTFSRIYEDSAQKRYIAEDVEVVHANGDVLTLERYSVEGDYQAPANVLIDAIAISEAGKAQPLLTIASLVLREPSQAVLSVSDLDLSVFSLAGVSARDISLQLDDDVAAAFFEGFSDAPLEGAIHLDALTLEALTSHSIELVDMQGLSAALNQDESGIAAALTLDNLRVEQLVGLDTPGTESVEHVELNGFSLAGDSWDILFDRLWVEGSSYIGEAGFEGLQLDVAELINLMPSTQRRELQSLSNVLTGGTGQLSAHGYSQSRWEEGATNRLLAEGRYTFSGAAEVDYTMDIPMTLPKDVTVEQAMQQPDVFERVIFHGGDIMVAYSDEGMLPRLATEVAARDDMTEDQTIAHAWSQAQYLSPRMGPQMTKLIFGLIDIMAGNAEKLVVNVGLPTPFSLNHFIMSPLRYSEQLNITFQLK